MATSPGIILIHASDASQHTGELKSILQRMQSADRISQFVAADISVSPPSLEQRKEDSVIMLLTRDLEPIREKIEKQVRDLNLKNNERRFIEIIVDNLPYNNNFISLPEDLKPIRSRDDMNEVWRGIELDLEQMFPAPIQAVRTQPIITPDRFRFIKFLGVSVSAAIFSVVSIRMFEESFSSYLPLGSGYYADYYSPFHFAHYPEEYYAIRNNLILFSILLPVIVYFSNKKRFESNSLSTPEQVNGTIHWTNYLKQTGSALLVFLLSFFIFFSLFSSGLLNHAGPMTLATLTALLLLYFQNKTFEEQTLNEPPASLKAGSRPSKYLKFGALIILILVAGAKVGLLVVQVVGYLGYYGLMIAIITAFFAVLISQRRRKSMSASV